LNPDFVPLGRNDFRRTRAFLAPHIFAIGGDLPDPPATDLLDPERWNHVMHLADDVALRSSSYSGAVTARMSELAYAWLRSFPTDPAHAPFMHEVALGAHEEFEAATFIALNGFYRQALGSLRSAVELMTHAAALSVTNDVSQYAARLIVWCSRASFAIFRDSCGARWARACALMCARRRPVAFDWSATGVRGWRR
jgi:hypothetical protein